MKMDELVRRWPTDIAQLQAFRREFRLDDWPVVDPECVPDVLRELVDIVGLLTMQWKDVLELQRRGTLSPTLVEAMARAMADKQHALMTWDLSVKKTDGPESWAVSCFRETWDTLVFLFSGERFMDPELRT